MVHKQEPYSPGFDPISDTEPGFFVGDGWPIQGGDGEGG